MIITFGRPTTRAGVVASGRGVVAAGTEAGGRDLKYCRKATETPPAPLGAPWYRHADAGGRPAKPKPATS